MTIVRPLAPVLAAALLLTACGDRSVVTEAPAPAATSSTASRWTLTGPGSKLSKDQLEQALLTKDDMPDDGRWEPFTPTPAPTDASVYDTVEPQSCKQWFQDRVAAQKAPAYAQATDTIGFEELSHGKEGRTEVTYQVLQYESPEKAQEAMKNSASVAQKCKTLHQSTTSESGLPVTVDATVEKLDFARPGDDSVALRMYVHTVVSADKQDTYQDTLRVQVGHNVMAMTLQGHQAVDAAVLKKVLDAGFARLDQASRS